VLDHFPDATLIAGVATAGIAHGALIADLLKLPFVYVRSEPKKHGMGNQIEGAFTPGQKVVVVEDLVSTGGSSLKVVDVLKSQGLEVMGMLALFTYGFPQAQQAFESYNLPLHTISNYEALVELMAEKNSINETQFAQLQSWRLNPSEWGK
jgi:orotate phosphoribosyltransferase